MDENQQAQNNQVSGIGGSSDSMANNPFTNNQSNTPAQTPSAPQQTAPVSPQPIPSATPMPAEAPKAMPEQAPSSMHQMDVPSVQPGENLSDKTLVGGVEETHEKSHFSFSPFHKSHEAVAQTDNPITTPTSYNEVTALGSKNKFAIIAILIGFVLLLAAGGAYYYLMVLNKPVEPTPQSVVEQPVTPPAVVEDTTIDSDPYIMQINQLEATSSADPAVLNSQLKSLDVSGIDTELNSGSAQTVPAGSETPPAVNETQPAPAQP